MDIVRFGHGGGVFMRSLLGFERRFFKSDWAATTEGESKIVV